MAAQSEIAMIEKLAGFDNYFFWKVLIEAIIYEKDWSEVILTASSADESRKTPEWNKINQHVRSLILRTVTKNVMKHISDLDSAFEMWTNLQNQYGRISENVEFSGSCVRFKCRKIKRLTITLAR